MDREAHINHINNPATAFPPKFSNWHENLDKTHDKELAEGFIDYVEANIDRTIEQLRELEIVSEGEDGRRQVNTNSEFFTSLPEKYNHYQSSLETGLNGISDVKRLLGLDLIENPFTDAESERSVIDKLDSLARGVDLYEELLHEAAMNVLSMQFEVLQKKPTEDVNFELITAEIPYPKVVDYNPETGKYTSEMVPGKTVTQKKGSWQVNAIYALHAAFESDKIKGIMADISKTKNSFMNFWRIFGSEGSIDTYTLNKYKQHWPREDRTIVYDLQKQLDLTVSGIERIRFTEGHERALGPNFSKKQIMPQVLQSFPESERNRLGGTMFDDLVIKNEPTQEIPEQTEDSPLIVEGNNVYLERSARQILIDRLGEEEFAVEYAQVLAEELAEAIKRNTEWGRTHKLLKQREDFLGARIAEEIIEVYPQSIEEAVAIKYQKIDPRSPEEKRDIYTPEAYNKLLREVKQVISNAGTEPSTYNKLISDEKAESLAVSLFNEYLDEIVYAYRRALNQLWRSKFPEESIEAVVRVNQLKSKARQSDDLSVKDFRYQDLMYIRVLGPMILEKVLE